MWGKLLMKSLGKWLQNLIVKSNCTKSSDEENCNACLGQSKQCNCLHTNNNNNNNNNIEEGVTNMMMDTKNDADDDEANSSFAHAVINMVGMLIGLGQLSTPYGVEQGGWAYSSTLLIGLGIMCTYTSHILGKCLRRYPTKLRSYADIGGQAFGSKGRILVSTFIYMEIFMALISYTISLHDNLITVFLGTTLKLNLAKLSTSQLLTIVAVFIALPTMWIRDLSSISFLSTLGILMSVVIFVSLAAAAVFGGVLTNHSIPVFQMHNIPSISGLFLFSYGGHIVFPNIYKAMKDPSKFTKVSIVSFTIVTALYMIIGFLGAKMFGPNVNSQFTLSMPPKQIITKIALWATVLTPMTKYALEFAPFAIHLEHRLPSSMSGRTKMVIRGCAGSIFLLIILALALSVPYFEHVLSLTGSLVSAAVCLILPSSFYLKIFWGQIAKPLLLLNFFLIILGFFLGVMGTISSSRSLVESFQAHHSS
ncbi:hypothetical protein HN51_064617 [Arachis hypogaea]|uniref:Amino acid transporter transmembrane domain-containing protein n=1 Tax=Arachis hypogaea TaxID=3818 RepID=A0A444ZBK3_ARAHY|nr:amino acid transporter AVT1H [Arachis hypogaea]QHO05675.1 vacuolar amino acid transporter [Arachis hypogaea]RYR11549.1 hypothetical protein Ahy_B04g069062 [Arachis hypogaea]